MITTSEHKIYRRLHIGGSELLKIQTFKKVAILLKVSIVLKPPGIINKY